MDQEPVPNGDVVHRADAETRRKGYQGVQELWNEQLPALMFAQTDQRVAMVDTLRNYVFSVPRFPQYYFISRS